MSRNYSEFRDQPKGVIGRLAANEIEGLVRTLLRGRFTSHNFAETVGADRNDIHAIEFITSRAAELDIDRVIRDCCSAIILNRDMIELTIDRVILRKIFQEQFGITFRAPLPDETFRFSAPYNFSRTRKGGNRHPCSPAGFGSE